MLLFVSHWYPPGDIELFASSGYQTLLLHTIEDTTPKCPRQDSNLHDYFEENKLTKTEKI
jgi:hypothetical protein